MTPKFEIAGGAGEEEAAAIVAVVVKLLADEAAARARPPAPARHSTWVMSGRPREVLAPLPSHIYDAQPWSELEPGFEGELG